MVASSEIQSIMGHGPGLWLHRGVNNGPSMAGLEEALESICSVLNLTEKEPEATEMSLSKIPQLVWGRASPERFSTTSTMCFPAFRLTTISEGRC